MIQLIETPNRFHLEQGGSKLPPCFISDAFFQPLLHGSQAFIGHREIGLAFHLALFISIKAVPEFHGNGAGFKVHFLGGCHDHIGFGSEAKHAAGAGKQIAHGKPVERRQINFRHYSSPTSCSISSISSPKSFSAAFTGSGEVISTPAPFSRSMGLLEQPPDKKPR